MKKWLIMLALSLAITGCTAAKDEAKEKKEAAKSEAKAPKPLKVNKIKEKAKEKLTPKEAKHPVVLIKDMSSNKIDLVLFLNRAEKVFEDLQYAAAIMHKGKTVTEDGILYRQLPAEFDTKDKIIAYFSRFWSKPLAVKMYDNLHTKIVKGKLYLAHGAADYHLLITTKNTTMEADKKGITATVKEATLPAFASDTTITYRLERDKQTKQFEIYQRLGTYGAKMFD